MNQESITDVLSDVELEVNRFLKRLKEAQERLKGDKWGLRSTKESARLRRGALDLKNELTRITQSTSY